MNLLAKLNIKCYCCGAEKWQYQIWKCDCGYKFYGDKWNYEPTCDCSEEPMFRAITDGSEFFQLHHLTYKNLGMEKDNELIILCEDCHKLVHCLIRIYPFLRINTAPEYVKSEKLRRLDVCIK